MSESEDTMVEGGSQKVIKFGEKFSTFHMVAFIICAVIGRQYMEWQPALNEGFGQFMVAQIIVGAAFIMSYLYMAEIWSAVPFSGGLYGLARAVIGFYPGFLVGVAEVLLYVTHSAMGANFFGLVIVYVFKLPSHATIGIVAGVYLCATLLAIQPSAVVMRRSFVALAFMSVAIILIWVFGAMKYTDFKLYASLYAEPFEPVTAIPNLFDGKMKSFLLYMPMASMPYAGTNAFTLMTGFTSNPKTTLPRAVMITMAIIFCINMFVVFVNASQPYGIKFTANFIVPMFVSWQYMFEIDFQQTVYVVCFLTFPAYFARVYSYVLPCGVLLQSLGRTNLLPSAMGLQKNRDHTLGVIWTSVLGFIMCLWIHFQPSIDLMGLCMLLTCFTTIAAMYCYIKFKYFAPNLERAYLMPLGIPGAVYVVLMLSLMFVAAAFYQDNYFPIYSFAALVVVLTVYYYAFAAKGQTMSKEEDKVFLMLHVKNFNHNKKKRRPMATGTRVQPATAGLKSPATASSGGGGGGGEHSTASTSQSGGALWIQLRKLNPFANDTVAPDAAVESSHASSHESASAAPVAEPAAADLEEGKAAETADDRAEGSTRRAEVV